MDMTLITIELASLSLSVSKAFIVGLCQKGLLQAYSKGGELIDRRKLALYNSSYSRRVSHIPGSNTIGSRIDINQLRFDPDEIKILKDSLSQKIIEGANDSSQARDNEGQDDKVAGRPIVEVDVTLLAGKTPDMAKIELRKTYDEPIVAYVLHQHFGNGGAGMNLSKARLGELMWPDEELSESAFIKKFNKLLGQAKSYSVVLS